MLEQIWNAAIVAVVTVGILLSNAAINMQSFAMSIFAPSIVAPNQVPAGTKNLATVTADASPARKALDAVGGKDIKLGTSSSFMCGENADPLACSYKSKVVLIHDRDANKDYDFWYPVMMHEYAHQIQYTQWDALNNSPEYKDMFGSDYELLADCMANARIPGYVPIYGKPCSAQQKDFGRKVWNHSL